MLHRYCATMPSVDMHSLDHSRVINEIMNVKKALLAAPVALLLLTGVANAQNTTYPATTSSGTQTTATQPNTTTDASATTPNVPNTGAGGSAAETELILTSAGIAAVAGALLLLRKRMS